MRFLILDLNTKLINSASTFKSSLCGMVVYSPADTRRLFNVYKTSYRRWNDVVRLLGGAQVKYVFMYKYIYKYLVVIIILFNAFGRLILKTCNVFRKPLTSFIKPTCKIVFSIRKLVDLKPVDLKPFNFARFPLIVIGSFFPIYFTSTAVYFARK